MKNERLFKMYTLLLLGSMFTIGLCQNEAKTTLQSISACNGKITTIRCGTNETVLPEQVIDGVRKVNNGQCEYTSGDCYALSKLTCNVGSNCGVTLFATTPLQGCNEIAEYRTVRYYCIPRIHPNKFDICANSSITAENGIISSPGYPVYQQLSGVCTTRIEVPSGKSLNIYPYEFKIKGRNSNNECDDFLKVTDSTGETIFCDNELEIFKDKLCSNVVYISYKASDKYSNNYRGFSLYFETRDVSTSVGCQLSTPSPPPTVITTTPFVPPEPVVPIIASEYLRLQVCKGRSQKIDAPQFTEIYIEQINYRVQKISGICLEPSQADCIAPYNHDCNLRPTCTISLLADATVLDCQSKKADSISAVYRFIPISSTIKYYVCTSQLIAGDAVPNGVLYSRNYPNYESNANCVLKLKSNLENKAFKVYLTDLKIEESSGCTNSYVELFDNKKYRSRFCGSIGISQQYSFTSCTNNVDITYVTKGGNSEDYRGFRMYYELIDLPAECIDTTTAAPTTPTTTTFKPVSSIIPITTTTTSTTTLAPLSEVISQISTTDGQKCVLPFRFNSTTSFEGCVPEANKYWCSLTANYEVDRRRGDCTKSPTGITTFSTCRLNSRTFSCPKGYLINLISMIGFQTTNGVCNSSAEICRHDATGTFQKTISGKNSYRFEGAPLLLSCNNAPADTTVFEYNCIPDSVPYLDTYNVCGNIEISTDNVQNGFIISPNFPTPQTNLNCELTIKTNGPNRILNIYSVESSLHVPSSNQQCSEAYVEINGERYCGNLLTEFLAQKCSSTFKFRYILDQKPYRGFKLYFEVKNVTTPLQCLEVTTPSIPVSSTITPLPPWAALNISSGLLNTVSCASNPVKSLLCPNNYILSIRSYFYGKSSQNRCFYSIGDCVGRSDLNLRCSGQRECALPNFATLINECNEYSTYFYVDYECIPTHLNRNRLACGTTVTTYTARNGIFTTKNHPIYDENLNCSARISTLAGTIIKVYLFETSILNDCSRDSITFSEANVIEQMKVCGQYNADLVYESCSNVLNLNIITKQSNDNNLKGVAVYYQSETKPANYICTKPTSTTVRTTTIPPSTTTGTPPPYVGLSSPLYRLVTCQSTTRIDAPRDYVILVRSSVYGVNNATDRCIYDTNDCFAPYSTAQTSCSGFVGCNVLFDPNTTVASCQSKKNSYRFVEYQFVPKFKAGKPMRENNTVLCQDPDPVIPLGSSILIQSPNYAIYPTSPYTCNRTVNCDRDQVIDVYLLKADFRGSNSCNQSTDFVRMTDGIEDVYFCKFSGNYARHVFRTASNFVNIQSMILSVTPPTTAFYGFQLYLEAVPKPVISTVFTNPVTKSTTTAAVLPGFASQEYEINMCVDDKKELKCPNDYVIIVTEEYLVYSTSSCKYGGIDDCREPSDRVTDLCRGQDSCKIDFTPVQITTCNSQYANGLDFKYLCIPAKEMASLKTYTCDLDKRLDKVRNGFIQSPGYPRFIVDRYDCAIELVPAERTEYRVYAIDFALNDDPSNILHVGSNSFIQNAPAQLLFTSSEPFKVSYTSPKVNLTSEIESKLRGFKLYFEAFAPNSIATTTRKPKSTTEEDDFMIPSKKKSGSQQSSRLMIGTLAVGLPLLLVIIILIFFLNRSGSSNGDTRSRVQFSNRNNDGSPTENIKSFSNPL